MSNLKEIPSSMYRVIDTQLYFVRLFGIEGRVYEEQLVPVPEGYVEDTPRMLFNRQRDQLFADTEWIRQRHADQVALGVDDAANWAAWLEYWQALRDIPTTDGFNPAIPAWPEKPE